MSDESIKFSFNKNKKVYVEVKSDGTIVHGKKDKSKQLATIFEQIAALNDNTTMIDSAEERKLVKMLRAIFSLGDSENIDKDELKWINELGTNDVKNYIEAKYNALKGNITKEYLVTDEELAKPKVDTEKQQARDNIIKGLADRVQAVEGATADGQQVYKETHGKRFFIFNENNEFCEVVEQGGNYVIQDNAVIKPDDIAEDQQVVAEREAAAQIQAQKAADQQRRNQIKTSNDQLSSKVDTLVKDLGDVTAQKGEYEVKIGDRLWNIAIEQLNKQEVTNPSTQQIINMIAQIKKLNPEMDINNLKIGQKIKLPATEVESPKGDDQDFVKKDETEQIKLIKEMNLEELCKLAGRVVYKGNDDKDGDLKDLGNDVKKAIVERAVELYKEGKGDPANLMNLLNIRTLITWVTFDNDKEKNTAIQAKLRDDILETFFKVTGEGEDKTYTFNPTRPMIADEQERFEKVLNESGSQKMKAAYQAYKNDLAIKNLVRVPAGTPEGVQEVFNEANEFLTELANMENKPNVVSERYSDHYEFKTAVDGKIVRIDKYDDGKIKIYINSNTDKRDTKADGSKYDGWEVVYEIDKDGKMTGQYNNDYNNTVFDGTITVGIDKDAIEELARKILNRGKYQTDFNNIVDYYVGAYVGEKLYGAVKGLGSGDAANIIKDKITKDNVIGVIEKFNALAKDSIYDQEITLWLCGETNLDRTQHDVIPAQKLLDKAKELGLENSYEYKNLKSAIEKYLNDHSSNQAGSAKKVDENINLLITKIKEAEAKK